MVWSPASCSASTRQSIQASTSDKIGDPVAPRCHPRPGNLSAPLVAKTRQTSSCSMPRTFTQNAPEGWMRGHDVDDLAGANATNGGSSDTEKNEPQVSPTGSSPSMPVTIVMPLA